MGKEELGGLIIPWLGVLVCVEIRASVLRECTVGRQPTDLGKGFSRLLLGACWVLVFAVVLLFVLVFVIVLPFVFLFGLWKQEREEAER